MISTETRSYDSFELSPALKKSLSEAGFQNATPIQTATIPLGLERRDIIGCAQTGTGKTAAFLVPTISYLEKNPESMALIMAPTREIVHQITEAARVFLKNHPHIKVATVIGGARMDRQLNALARRPQLVVGTPGRLNDLLDRRKLHLNTCHTLVLDEADRMLDMGFAPQIDTIIKVLPKNRQSVMFSATMAPPVEKLAKTYLKDAQFVSVGAKETAPDALKQKIIITSLEKKEDDLLNELKQRAGSVLVFAETQRRVEKLCYKLRDFGFEAESIHGGRSQGQRFRALRSFKEGDVSILVATDVASRGLDIGNISHVINYDLPSNPEDFLHRIGRTARNGKDGEAVTLVLPADYQEYKRIKKYLKNCETIGEFEVGIEFLPQMGSRRRRGGGFGGNRSRGFGGGGGNRNGGGGRFQKRGSASGAGGRSFSGSSTFSSLEQPRRDDRPARFERQDGRPARPNRQDRPARFDRPERAGRPDRQDRPARSEQQARPERPQREFKAAAVAAAPQSKNKVSGAFKRMSQRFFSN